MEIPMRFAASLSAWVAVLCALTQSSPIKFRPVKYGLLYKVNTRLFGHQGWFRRGVTNPPVTLPTIDVTTAAADLTGSGAPQEEKRMKGAKKGKRGKGMSEFGRRLAKKEVKTMRSFFRQSLRRQVRQKHVQRPRANVSKGRHQYVG